MPHHATTILASANVNLDINAATTIHRNATYGHGTDIAKITTMDNAHSHIGKVTYRMHLEHTTTTNTTVNLHHTIPPIRNTMEPHNAGGIHNPGGHHNPGGTPIHRQTIRDLRLKRKLTEIIVTTTIKSGQEDDHSTAKSHQATSIDHQFRTCQDFDLTYAPNHQMHTEHDGTTVLTTTDLTVPPSYLHTMTNVRKVETFSHLVKTPKHVHLHHVHGHLAKSI